MLPTLLVVCATNHIVAFRFLIVLVGTIYARERAVFVCYTLKPRDPFVRCVIIQKLFAWINIPDCVAAILIPCDWVGAGVGLDLSMVPRLACNAMRVVCALPVHEENTRGQCKRPSDQTRLDGRAH